MSGNMRSWVRLPSVWIRDGGLQQFRWSKEGGADEVAALMSLMVIAHHAADDTGLARLTYKASCRASGISRGKLSNGLDLLEERGIIARAPDGRSSYALANYDVRSGWAKLPAKRLYAAGRIFAFDDFRLRQPGELAALKLYLLFAQRRDDHTNLAHVTYDKIEEQAGIDRRLIRTGLSILAVTGLVHVERVPSRTSQFGIASAYRLVYLDSSRHMGTIGRSVTEPFFDGMAVTEIL